MGKRNVRKIENKNKGFVDEVFDVIFYLPRKVHRKNMRLKYLENEVKFLRTELIKTREVCHEVVAECETTTYGNDEVKIRRIKEIAECV